MVVVYKNSTFQFLVIQYFNYPTNRTLNYFIFISAPCGDARIFSPHEAEPSSDPNSSADPHPNRKARGQLRTKIESGEGTIPVKSSDGIQTWDGALQGSRLLTMSCSGELILIYYFKKNWKRNFELIIRNSQI